jgi:glycosyltransferase involved in cell wall biosynthesis
MYRKEEVFVNFLNVGTYPPRQCGIASFSRDLRDNLVSAGHSVWIAAISDEDTYAYPPEVRWVIRQECREDYIRAAGQASILPHLQAVIIQHEYGIYGGADGGYILDFLSVLDKPYLLVTHTVLPQPGPNQKMVLRLLAQKAAAVICMSERSAHLLERVYSVDREKVAIIPHGVPVFQPKEKEELKRSYGCSRRRVITTFGLIGPSKGLENGILAVKRLVDRHPDLLYIIAGRTHPVLQRRDGESYREKLLGLVADLGLQDHVRFVNRFLDVEELGDYLYLTDVYLSPYPNRDQAVSGTLAYALGCGRAIVSTPYEYALGVLKKNRCGLVAPDASPEALSRLLDQVLSRPELQRSLEIRASRLGEEIKWPRVAARYADVARQTCRRPARAFAGEKVIPGELAAAVEKKGLWRW